MKTIIESDAANVQSKSIVSKSISFDSQQGTGVEIAVDLECSELNPKVKLSDGSLDQGQALSQCKVVDIEFRNISYAVPVGPFFRKKENKVILEDLSGCFRSGELTAIMGPSGAGKSSLMNTLAGYTIKNVSGTILINGEERDLRLFRKLSCYIMQDDQLLPHLNVMEAMMVAANLKLSEKIKAKEKRDMVLEVLDMLGLSDSKYTRTAKLSGGQRKRLSMALELVNNPPIMFFDEPTSGLDSQSCWQCLSLLKSLALGGRTIICTIHQPSAKLFEIFDKLYMLADGRCIYNGPVRSIVPFLKSQGLNCPPYHNPADFIIEIACGEYGSWTDKLAPRFLASADGKMPDSIGDFQTARTPSVTARSARSVESVTSGEFDNYPGAPRVVGTQTPMNQSILMSTSQVDKTSATALLSSSIHTAKDGIVLQPQKEFPSFRSRSVEHEWRTFATNSWTQFCVLFVRTFRCIVRDTNLTRLRFMSHTCVGFIIGLLYYGIGNDAASSINNCASLFFTCMFLMFTALMPTVMTFPLEMNVLVREHMNYWYSLKSYYFAKTMADLPFQVIFPMIYGSIVYWMTWQPCEAIRFILFLTLSILTSLVAQSLGLFIGAATSLQVAVFLGPVTAIPILLFSGFFLRFGDIPWYFKWFSHMSYVRYTFEGTLLSIYGFEREKMDCEDKNSTLCVYAEPKNVLLVMDVDGASWWTDILVLWGFFFLFRFLAYFALRYRVRSQR